MTDKEADKLFDSILHKLEKKLGREILANFNKLTEAINSIIKNPP